jgi:hypothetical protein
MPETFAPESNGWRLQRDYSINPEWIAVEDERELGNVSTTAVARRSLRTFPLRWRATTRASYDYMVSFFNRNVGPVARFNYSLPEFVASPDAGPLMEAVVAGTQALRTIFAKFAWRNSIGTTLAGNALSLSVPANSLLKLTLPPYPPSVGQAVIYATEGADGTELQQAVLTDATTWTQPDNVLLIGTDAPLTVNTAIDSPLCKMVQGSFSVQRGAGISYIASIQLQEVYT